MRLWMCVFIPGCVAINAIESRDAQGVAAAALTSGPRPWGFRISTRFGY